MKKTEAQALRKVVDLVSGAQEDSASRTPGVRLVIGMDRQRRVPKFEIEDVEGPDQGAADDFDAALAEARERGVSRAAQILAGPDMLSGSAFAKFIGVSREAVRPKQYPFGLYTQEQDGVVDYKVATLPDAKRGAASAWPTPAA